MPTPERLEKLERAVSQRQDGLIMVVENMQDPHNAMAIVRTCEAFGVGRVFFIFDNFPSINPKKVGKSTSSTANKWVDFETFDSTEACVAKLHEDGYEVVATVLSDKAESLYDADLTGKKIAILIGNETKGLSQTAQDLADRHVMIPMRGMVQSLNV